MQRSSFFKIVLVQNSKELNKFFPQSAATTFAFCSVFILFFYDRFPPKPDTLCICLPDFFFDDVIPRINQSCGGPEGCQIDSWFSIRMQIWGRPSYCPGQNLQIGSIRLAYTEVEQREEANKSSPTFLRYLDINLMFYYGCLKERAIRVTAVSQGLWYFSNNGKFGSCIK